MQRYCVCGNEVKGKRALCEECHAIYGKKASEWPEWLRFWVNDVAREIRDEREIDKHETCFTDLDLEE